MCIGKSYVLAFVPKERNNQVFLIKKVVESGFKLQKPILELFKAWGIVVAEMTVSIRKEEILINEVCLPRLINIVINELSLVNEIVNLCNHHSSGLTNRRLHELDVLV